MATKHTQVFVAWKPAVRKWDRELNKHVEIEPGRKVNVQVTVDMDGIAALLGGRAAASRGGKAVEAGGNVIVKVVKS